MFLIVFYDAPSKKCNKYRKILKKYLFPIQESVFEGYLTENQTNSLIQELTIPPYQINESIVIYSFDNSKYLSRKVIGKQIPSNRNII